MWTCQEAVNKKLISFFGVRSFSDKQFSTWLNYAHKVLTNLEPIPSVIYSVKLKVFSPCCSFRPKSIVKEQKSIFFFYDSMMFEGISDFIHPTDFYIEQSSSQ